jgi:hypothetical protein
MACKGLLAGKRVLYATPKETQTEAFWRNCKDWLAPLLPYGLYKNETLHLLEMPGLGIIRAKTGYDADTLRGDYADILLLDEFSFMDPDVWGLVGQPMLLDNDGDAVFTFTPVRKNHAYRLYLKAQADETGRWQAWHATTHDNPYLSKDALADLTADMTKDAYRQEIMAEFLDMEGQVFRNVRACLWGPDEAEIRKHKGHHLVAGLDWGRQSDATAMSIGCADCCVELVLDRFTQISFPIQRDRVKAHNDRWHPRILAESNSIGAPNIEQLQHDGIRVTPFDTTNKSKGEIIESLQLALEKQTWKWLDNRVATGELEAYEQKPTRLGNMTYGAPEGLKDDTVMARAIMLRAASHKPMQIRSMEGDD